MKNYFNSIRKGNKKKKDEYFKLLSKFEKINKLTVDDLENYKNQMGGSPNLIQSILLGSVFLLGYQVLKNKKIKSLSKLTEESSSVSDWSEVNYDDEHTTFLFFRLIRHINKNIEPDMKKNKLKYIKFLDVLIENCNKLLEIFPPNLDNGLCIYDNKQIINEKKIQNTTMKEFI